MPFSGPKWCICPEQNFFGTNCYYYFHLAIGPFHCAKLKKLLQWIQSYEDAPFLGPKWYHLPHTNFFFLKIINITLIYQLFPFIVQNFKKILPADPELWKLAIFGPKMAHFPKWHLKKKQPVNEPCFFHSCLSIFHKWKSDINRLLKYWWLKNTEISLAESHFWL